MTRCCCLACIEGFGRCSSAPKPDPRGHNLAESIRKMEPVEQTIYGMPPEPSVEQCKAMHEWLNSVGKALPKITIESTPCKPNPFFELWNESIQSDETTYILNRDYVSGVTADGTHWNLTDPHTEESI